MRRWPLSHRLRVADSLCSSGRRSGSGRGLQNVPSPSEKLQTLAPPGDGRALAVDLWWFLLAGFRFLEALALFQDRYPAAAARQPASANAATECWVYLSTDTERMQR